MLSPSDRKRAEDMLKQLGLSTDDSVIMHNLSITGVPQDTFLTKSIVRRAKAEAADIEENYRCPVCGRKYNNRNEFVECYQDHIISFYAGTPIDKTPEYEKAQFNMLPEPIKQQLRQMGVMPQEEEEQ